MAKYHKHKGIAYSSGELKSHPINVGHKNKETKHYHNLAIGIKEKPSKAKKEKFWKDTTKKEKPLKEKKIDEQVVVDNEGYLAIDINNIKAKGVRVINVDAGKVYIAKNGKVSGVEFNK